MSSKANTIFSGVFWTVVCNVVNIIFGFISVPLLINHFGKDIYGLIGIAGSVNVYLNLLDMGMTGTNVRFFSEYLAKGNDKQVQTLFSFTQLFYLVIGLINTIALFVVSFYVDSLFKVDVQQSVILRHLILILALNSTFSWVSACYDQFLRSKELMSWLKKRAAILRASVFMFLAITIVCKLPIEFYYFFLIFSATFILPLSISKIKKLSPSLSFKFGYNKEIFKTVVPYALTIFSFSIFQSLTFYFSPLLLGNMIGPESVAEFNVMATIASVITMVTTSFIPVLLPVVTKMRVTDDAQGLNSMVNQGTKYVAVLITFMVFGLILSCKELIFLYVGEDFACILKWLILWLLTLLLSHRNVMTSLVYAEKNLSTVVVMGAVAMVVAFVCYFTLVPKIGVGGVVIGFAAHELIHTLYYYVYFIPKTAKIKTAPIFIKSVMPVWIITASICALIWMVVGKLPINDIWALIVKSVVYALLFFPVVWKFLFNQNDRQFVIGFIRRKI